MQGIFQSINGIFSFIGPLSDFLWDFPTNFEWYAGIPILGNFSFAIILLLGSGLYFSFRLGFVQVRSFQKGLGIMTEKRTIDTGISPLAAFLLSSAMRVGPGNILGATGAIAVGGPNAEAWAAMDKLPKFAESLAVLTPGTSFNAVVTFVITHCLCWCKICASRSEAL